MKYTPGFLLLLFLPVFLHGQSVPADPAKNILLADSLFQAGDYESAARNYKLASITYKILDKKKYLFYENKIADCLARQGRLEEAENLAGTMLKECSSDEERAQLWNTMGLINLNKGKYEIALQYFSKALTYYTTQDQPEQVAYCYNNIGLTNWATGNNQLALEHLSEALDLRKTIFGETHQSVAASYNNIGLVYSEHDPEAALSNYEKALNIYSGIYQASHPLIASTLNNIGIIQRKKKDYAGSIETFKKCLDIRIRVFSAEHPNVAFIYSNIGQSFFENAQYDSALSYQEKALKVYKKNYGEKHPEIAHTYNLIGTIHEKSKKYDLALADFQSALCANSADFNSADISLNPPLSNYYNSDLLLMSLLLKARTLESRHYEKTLKLKDLELSLQTLELCDSLISRIRQFRTSKNDKISLGRTAAEIYEDAVSIASDLGQLTLRKNYYLTKAFSFCEKNKSAVLLEAIADAQAKSFSGIPDTLLEKEKELKAEIALYEQKLAERFSAEEEKALRNKLFNLNRQYEQFTKSLEQNYPEYYNLKYNSAGIRLDSVRSVLEEGTMLISYFLAENRKRIFVFCLTKKSLEVYNMPKNELLEKQIKGLRNSIRHRADKAFANFAHLLYKELVPSIPSGIKKLVIIPDGGLGTIPFEALLTKEVKGDSIDFSKLPYMIKRFSISYNYSATLFVQVTKESKLAKDIPLSVFLCAPVTFDSTEHLKPLYGSEAEVQNIDSIIGIRGYKTSIFLKKEANEGIVKSPELSNYKYLHFATHGVVDEEKPELSKIYLTATGDEDGDLYSGEIYNLNIKADLVTLSACETGLGMVSKGEGIIGLTRALLYAGSNNVLVSLWSVSDRSTAELMTSFYENLLDVQKKTNYAAAVRSGKLKLIQAKEFSHPYFWAPFILIGK
ncbi:MAG: CHAT domain-containing protein [Cytophagaceae bacterium]